MIQTVNSRLMIGGFIGLSLALKIGILIGHFGIKQTIPDPTELTYYQELIRDQDKSVLEKLIQEVNVENLKYHLKYIIY